MEALLKPSGLWSSLSAQPCKLGWDFMHLSSFPVRRGRGGAMPMSFFLAGCFSDPPLPSSSVHQGSEKCCACLMPDSTSWGLRPLAAPSSHHNHYNYMQLFAKGAYEFIRRSNSDHTLLQPPITLRVHPVPSSRLINLKTIHA